MPNIEKVKNHEGKTIFPVTVSDAVLMGNGQTLKGKLSELGSKVMNNSFVGKGNDYVSVKIVGLIPSHTYIIEFPKIWNTDSIDIEGTFHKFSISSWVGEASSNLVAVAMISDLKQSYEFVTPDSFDYITVGGRADEGDDIKFVITDVSEINNIKEDIYDRKELIPDVVLEGNDLEKVTKYVENLIPGHTYRVIIKENGELAQDINDDIFNFVISTLSADNAEKTDIVRVLGTNPIKDSYDFLMPEDGTSSIRIAVRRKKGSKLIAYVEDVTTLKALESNLNDSFGLFNLSQIKYGYQLQEFGKEVPAADYIITPFIPYNAGDLVEVYCGFIDTKNRLVGYDEEYNHIDSYAQVVDPRTVTFSQAKYIKACFNINNIGSSVKINGSVAFLWTKNLYETYLNYKKINEYEQSPLLKGFIVCSGNTVTSPCVISNILPNHIYRIHLADNNPPSDGYSADDTFKFSIRSYDKDGTTYDTLLNVVGKDVWENYYDIKTPSNANYLFLRARCEPNYKFVFFVEDISASVENTTKDIFAVNPIDEFMPKLQSAKKKYYTSEDTTKKQPVVLAHISDIHGNWKNVSRFVEFCNYWKDYIDILINTGDTVEYNYSNGYNGYYSTEGVENIINIIGNHDTQDSNGLSWQTHIGLDAYNSLIKPYVSNWGVVQPDDAEQNGHCYFYKDFVDNNLRIVFVDVMAYSDIEDNWLRATLEDAKIKNFHILIATHFSASTIEDGQSTFIKMENNYSTLYTLGTNSAELNKYNREAYKMMDTVQSYIESGGIFCGYVQGHYHADFVAKVTNYPKQLIYSIGATKAGEMRDYNHIVGTRNQDEFQIVSVDTYLNVVKLYKVGANVDLYGRHKNSIAINYQTGEVVAESY